MAVIKKAFEDADIFTIDEKIEKLQSRYRDELILKAIEIAEKKDMHSFRYVEAILKAGTICA